MTEPTPEAVALRDCWLKGKDALFEALTAPAGLEHLDDVLERTYLEMIEVGQTRMEPWLDRQTARFVFYGAWEHPNYTGIAFELIGQPSDPRDLLGQATKALKAGGREDLAEQFFREALMGDADHLIRMCLEYFDVPSTRD